MELRYFRYEEFDCKCKKCRTNSEGLGIDVMDEDFLRMLDDARHKAGVAFHISSGVRCTAHNRASGGKKDSAHLDGLAADIVCTDSRTRGYILGALYEAGFNRIGVHRDFLHVDDHPAKDADVVWLYD
jgi:zinc D-Ala-D-Ala carboxypeptidase